jgi:hypothetical protein
MSRQINLENTYVAMGRRATSREKSLDPEKSMLYSSKVGLGSKSVQEKLNALDKLNKRQRERTGHPGFGNKDCVNFDENQLALVTLGTIANMAADKVLDKNYYTVTRVYLENLTDGSGLQASNVPEFLRAMQKFQEQHNLVDSTIDFDNDKGLKSNEFDDKTLREIANLEDSQVGKKIELKLPEPKVFSSTMENSGVPFEVNISNVENGTNPQGPQHAGPPFLTPPRRGYNNRSSSRRNSQTNLNQGPSGANVPPTSTRTGEQNVNQQTDPLP